MVTSAIVCGLGDLLCQGLTSAGGLGALRTAVDLRRLAVYTAMGGLYVAPTVHAWFGALERITGTSHNVSATAQAVFVTRARVYCTVQTACAWQS
jgi:hypothetical protein